MIPLKNKKYWTPKNAEIILKFEQCGFSSKDADSMANSVDPDQTALLEQSELGLIWVYTVCLDLVVQTFRIITVPYNTSLASS